MDIEELKKALESDEGKSLIESIVEKEVDGLKAKNEELLGSLKKEKEEKSELNGKLEEIEEAKKKAEEEAALKSGDVEKIKQQLEEKHNKEKEAMSAQILDKDTKLNKVLIDNGLTDALSKAEIAPQYMDAAKALIKSNHKSEVADQDGSAIALLDGKPITEFVSEWSQGDSGKHFKAAPANGGGGANGANGGGKAPGGQKRSEMSVEEKSAYVDEHGQKAYNELPA